MVKKNRARDIAPCLQSRFKNDAFFDSEENLKKTTDDREREANEFASNALIPKEIWESHKKELLTKPSITKTTDFAERLNVHRSIVAGRIRFEKQNYKVSPRGKPRRSSSVGATDSDRTSLRGIQIGLSKKKRLIRSN